MLESRLNIYYSILLLIQVKDKKYKKNKHQLQNDNPTYNIELMQKEFHQIGYNFSHYFGVKN